MWALGVVLYVLLCKQFPFNSDNPDTLYKQASSRDCMYYIFIFICLFLYVYFYMYFFCSSFYLFCIFTNFVIDIRSMLHTEQIPEDAKDLLHKIFIPSACKRMTLPEILHHHFLKDEI